MLDALRMADWPWPLLAAVLVAGPALWHALRVRRLRTVFLSYRRSDAAGATAQVAAQLRGRYGNGIFHDMADMRPGDDFRRRILHTLWRSDAALVMIGPDWATVTGANGRPRLWEDDDVVRAEVAAALASGALVVPLLVDDATLPRPEQLPPDLQPLLALNATRLPRGDQASVVAAVARTIQAAPLRQSLTFVAACHAAVVLQLAVFGWAGGLEGSELWAALGTTAPAGVMVVASAAMQRWRAGGPARVDAPQARAMAWALLVPLAFLAAMSLLVALRSLNQLGGAAFQGGLIAIELGFAAYTGAFVAGLQDLRRPAS